MENTKKIQNFTDLRVWQEAHRLVLDIYLLTKTFPKEELFGLVMQLRRAGVSVTSNIAEGFCRAGVKDRLHFYNMALASLVECQNQLLLSKDLAFLSEADFKMTFEKSVAAAKMLNALSAKIKANPVTKY